VGKSTLFNALLGEDRAIVTPVPGTTRDLVEGRAVWDGEAVRLVDTAGIRLGGDAVEREGMERARATAQAADVVLAVFDGAEPWTSDDEAVKALLPEGRTVVAVNKIDLNRVLELPGALPGGTEARETSALTGSGMDGLRAELRARLPGRAGDGGLSISRQRHRDLLVQVQAASVAASGLLEGAGQEECAAAELRTALRSLAELLGEDVGDDVLDRIFSEFCIGK
jgi:tRNA modification GTPase